MDGPGAGAGRADLRDHRLHQPAGDDDSARRAERGHGPVDRAPRLRARDGRGGALGHRRPARRERGGAARLPGRVTTMRTDGLDFEGHKVGAVYRTLARTVSETDIVSFVNQCGFTEPLFIDMEYVKRESVFKRRAAPGALTFALSEGLVMQTGLIHGTGMAFLGGELKVVAPVLEGDTIRVEVEVADKRETKKSDRGIVTYKHPVLNQRDEVVLEATIQPEIRRCGAGERLAYQ